MGHPKLGDWCWGWTESPPAQESPGAAGNYGSDSEGGTFPTLLIHGADVAGVPSLFFNA